MIGDQGDLVGRLKRFLPSRWFPTEAQNSDGTVPRIQAMLAGFAAVLAQVWAQLQYARAQQRIATSTDGWLDLAAFDFLGEYGKRLPLETDTVYAERTLANLVPQGPTRAAIAAALQELTGQVPVIVEPWNPNDTGILDGVPSYQQTWDEGVGQWPVTNGPLECWDAGLFFDAPGSYWQDLGSGSQTWDANAFGAPPCYFDQGAFFDAAGWFFDAGAPPAPDTPKWDQMTVAAGCYYDDYRQGLPGRWADRAPYEAYIDTIIPPMRPLGGNPLECWDAGLFFDAPGSYWQDLEGLTNEGQQQVFDLINRLKVEGTIVWVRFNYFSPPPALPVPGCFLDANAFFDAGGSFLN